MTEHVCACDSLQHGPDVQPTTSFTPPVLSSQSSHGIICLAISVTPSSDSLWTSLDPQFQFSSHPSASHACSLRLSCQTIEEAGSQDKSLPLSCSTPSSQLNQSPGKEMGQVKLPGDVCRLHQPLLCESTAAGKRCLIFEAKVKCSRNL